MKRIKLILVSFMTALPGVMMAESGTDLSKVKTTLKGWMTDLNDILICFGGGLLITIGVIMLIVQLLRAGSTKQVSIMMILAIIAALLVGASAFGVGIFDLVVNH